MCVIQVQYSQQAKASNIYGSMLWGTYVPTEVSSITAVTFVKE